MNRTGTTSLQDVLRPPSMQAGVRAGPVGKASSPSPANGVAGASREGQAGTEVFRAIQGVGTRLRCIISSRATCRHQVARCVPYWTTETALGRGVIWTMRPAYHSPWASVS
jgi:hypothetical protein